MAADDDCDEADPAGILVNRYFAEHPEMVLGDHAQRRPQALHAAHLHGGGVGAEEFTPHAVPLPIGWREHGGAG